MGGHSWRRSGHCQYFRGLNANQTQAVVDQLAADGTLDKLAREFTDDKIMGLGGLTNAERSSFFNDMASKLDGEGLKTLSDAFARTDDNSGGYSDVVALGQAVASHASTNVKVDYVQAMADSSTDRPDHSSSGIGGSSSRTGDAEAAAIGEVLGGLQGSPAAAEEAFGSLNNAQLQAVMAASIDETVNYSSHAVTASLDGKVAGQILASASQISNPDLKARIFDAGAETLNHINEDFGFPVVAIGDTDAANTLANGLTQLLDTDTTGIMRELAYNQESMDGAGISAYAKHLLNNDQEATLGQQMARLQLGNDLSEDPVARFEEAVTLNTGAQRYENAGSLGYFVGGVYSATDAISSDVATQREMTTNVLNSALSAITLAAGPATAGAISIGRNWVATTIDAAIADPGATAAQQLERAAIPTNPNTGETGVGTAAFSGFNDRVSQVTPIGLTANAFYPELSQSAKGDNNGRRFIQHRCLFRS